MLMADYGGNGIQLILGNVMKLPVSIISLVPLSCHGHAGQSPMAKRLYLATVEDSGSFDVVSRTVFVGKVEDVEEVTCKTPVQDISFFLTAVFSSENLLHQHFKALCFERSQLVFAGHT